MDKSMLRCSVCGKYYNDVKKMFETTDGVLVCDECLPDLKKRRQDNKGASFIDEIEPNEEVRKYVLHIVMDELKYNEGSNGGFTYCENGEETIIREWNHHLPTAYMYGYSKLIYEIQIHGENYCNETHERVEIISKQFAMEGIDPADVIDTFGVAWSIAQRVGRTAYDNMAYGNYEIPCHAFLPRVYKGAEDVPEEEYNSYVDRMVDYNDSEVNLYIAFRHSLGIWTESLKKLRGKPDGIIRSLLEYKDHYIQKKLASLNDDYFKTKHRSLRMHPYIYNQIMRIYRAGLENDCFSPIVLIGDTEQLNAIAEETAVLLQRDIIKLESSNPVDIPPETDSFKLLYIIGDKKGKSINYSRLTSIRRGTIVIFGLSACKNLSMKYIKRNLSSALQDTYLDLNAYVNKSDSNEEVAFLRKLSDTARLIYVRPESEKRLERIRQSFNQFCMINRVEYYDPGLPLLYLYSLEDRYDLDFYNNSGEFLSRHYTPSDKPTRFIINLGDQENDEFNEPSNWMNNDDPIVIYSENQSLFELGERSGFNNIFDNIYDEERLIVIKNRSSIPVIIDSCIGKERIDFILSLLLDEERIIYIINYPADIMCRLGNEQIINYMDKGVMYIGSPEEVFARVSNILFTKKIQEFFEKKLTMRIGSVRHNTDDESFQTILFDDIWVERSYKKDRGLEGDMPAFMIGHIEAKDMLRSQRHFAEEKPFTILIGPTNVGKTTIIRVFASENHYAVYNLPAFDLLKHEFETDIKRIVDDISEEAPAIIHLDKLGSLFAEYKRDQKDQIESSLYLLESLVREKHSNNCEIRIIAESDKKDIPAFLKNKSLIIECTLPKNRDFFVYIEREFGALISQYAASTIANLCYEYHMTIKDFEEGIKKVDYFELHKLQNRRDDDVIDYFLEKLGKKEETDELIDSINQSNIQREKQLHPCPAKTNKLSFDDIYIPEGSEVLAKKDEWLDGLFAGYVLKVESNMFKPMYGGIIHGMPSIGKSFLVRCLAGELGYKNSGNVKGKAAEVYCIDLPLYINREKNEIDGDRFFNDLDYVLGSIQNCESPAVLLLKKIDEAHNDNLWRQMIWKINHFYSKYPVLVLSTLNESPTDDGHERTYVELLKEYFYGFSDIVDGLGGFIRMLPPTGVEYGKLLKRWLAARNLAFGNEGIYDALGEIFLTEGLTVIYRNLLVFLESCYQKYGANLTAKAMLEELYLKVNGREMDITDEDRRRVSFHEAGHAFVQEYFGNKSVLATIVPRGNYGGFVMPSRRNSKGLVKEEDWRNKICTSLAGRAAEQVLYFKDLSIRTAGAGGSDGSDLAHASRDAYAMVAILGMGSKLFMPLDRLFGNDDLWNKECMDEADHILHEEMNYTQRIIDANRDIVEKIAKLLEKEGTITANQIEECFEGSEITRLPREIAQAI